MSDDELFADIPARILMIETPADQVALPPPPPASAIEAAAMWRPADQPADEQRINVQEREDPSAVAAYGVWLGLSALHMVIADSRPEQKERVRLDPARDDEDDDRR